MRWLADCSPAAITEVLRAVAPELSGHEIVVRESLGEQDPQWWLGSAVVGERFVARPAWSQPAALRLAHEVGVLTALLREASVPFLPEVVASSTDPVLLVTRLVPGTALFDVVDTIGRDHAGRQLASFLAGMHHPKTLEQVEGLVGELPPALLPPAATSTIRGRFGKWIRPDQVGTVMRWCDWADDVLAAPRPAVLVHADLHGGNQVWKDGELRVVSTSKQPGPLSRSTTCAPFRGQGQASN